MDREIYTEDERWQSPVSDAYLDLWEKNKEKSDTYLHLSGESIAPPYAIRENLILLAVGRDRWQVFDLSSGPRSRLGRTFKVRADPGNVVLGLKQAFFYERASRKCYLLTLGKADLELLPVTRLVDRRDRDGFVLAEGNEEHIVYDLDTGNRFTARWNKPWAVEQLGLEAGYLQEFYGALSSIFPIDRREGRSGPDNNERIMSLIDMLLHNDLRKEAAFIAEELGPLDKAATLWSAAGASDGEKYHAAQILARLGMEYQAARTVRKAKGFFQKASQLFYAVGEMELADFFTRQAQG